MKISPKVSIGLPVYNGGLFLRQAIDSLLNQTYSDFEIIISDNASSDDTQSICMEYIEKDFRITYYRQEANIGASNNFEFVLSKASGAFFMWAAHDDLWECTLLDRLTSELELSDQIGFAFPSFRTVSKNFLLNSNSNDFAFNFLSIKNSDERLLRFANLHHSSNKCNIIYSLFRIDLIKKIYEKREILNNDGLICLVLVGMTMGMLVPGNLFIKRTKAIFPQFIYYIYYKFGFKGQVFLDFHRNLHDGTESAIKIYPQHVKFILAIKENYKFFNSHKNFLVIENFNEIK